MAQRIAVIPGDGIGPEVAKVGVRVLARLATVDLGIAADRIVSVSLRQLQGRYADEQATIAFADSLLESVRKEPAAAGVPTPTKP